MKNKLLIIRRSVLVFLTHHIALPLLKIVRSPQAFPYNMQGLKDLPAGSLGYDLYLFLTERNLQLLTYYARHDLKHIVLGYDTTEKGEACLQCFMLGNGRISFPVLATVGYALLTMPEYWKDMKAAFRKGRKASPIHHWQWSLLLHQQTASLRRKIFYPSFR
jgi:ubiquinone biosynthesis protein Coq4